VDRVEASGEAKTRLQRIVQTLTGEVSVAEACADLGVSESHFHRLRDRALAGAAEALEPRPAGRPRGATPTAAQERIAELEDDLTEMQFQLRAAELREELALVMPHVLRPPREKLSPEDQKKRRNAAKRQRRKRRGK
tara:strand:+ start:590 stop:1000 length:411 start_codon:yes stop_codon:yes gene_type:complete